jgi:hypothetical protein
MTAIAAVDMFVVATATFKAAVAVIVLNHHRRRVIHFEVTQNALDDHGDRISENGQIAEHGRPSRSRMTALCDRIGF